MIQSQLDKSEYPEYFTGYISLALDSKPLTYLSSNMLIGYLETLSEDLWSYSYAEGKWTVKEKILHVIDTERIFCYRALRFARNDSSILIGFDQDKFVPYSDANKRTIESLLREFKLVRAATISLFETFSKEQLDRIGQVGDSKCSVRALAYILVGHEIHHYNLLKERYII